MSPSFGFVSTTLRWPIIGPSHEGPLALGRRWVRSHAVYFPLQETKPTTDLLGHMLDRLRRQVAFKQALMQELTTVLKALISFMSLLCLPLVVLQWLLALCASFPSPSSLAFALLIRNDVTWPPLNQLLWAKMLTR